ANGPEAVAALDADRPDLVFLDVQMPGLNGFEVIEAVGVERMPATVFVTAYHRYALRAFEGHALDYLVKPVNRRRSRQALERARGRLRQARPTEVHELLRALLADVQTAARGPRRLIVKSDNRIALVKPEDVDWVEAAGNYVRLHVGKDEHLLRATMEGVEAQLPRQYVRIHRSTIVNFERIRSLEPGIHGDNVVQ